MNYEDKIKKLEDIINQLQSGEVNFDKASQLFEEGSKLCVELSKTLDETKGKITVIRETLDGLLEEDL